MAPAGRAGEKSSLDLCGQPRLQGRCVCITIQSVYVVDAVLAVLLAQADGSPKTSLRSGLQHCVHFFLKPPGIQPGLLEGLDPGARRSFSVVRHARMSP